MTRKKTIDRRRVIDELKTRSQGALKELARRKYLYYLRYVHQGKFKASKHHELIAETCDRVERGELKRVMFFMPPRHGKSMSVSETFPSYFIGKNPDRRVIETCYSDTLARKFGRANKQKTAEYGLDLFDVNLAGDNASVTNWGLQDFRGGMIASGIMGSITGEGADLLIVDDPIKNRQEAESVTYRERLKDEWQNTLLTRLHPGGAVIFIMTRWHEDDLAGWLLETEGDQWEVISLPAEAEEENDLLDRSIGEPLWPEHGFGLEWIAEKKRAVGSQTWNALYQQRPSPPEGALFKREQWNYYKKAPTFDEVIISADCTFKETDTSDYVVIQTWGRKGADKYLIDQTRARMDITATMNAIRSMSAKHRKARAKLIEDKANGPAVISMLKKEIPGMIPVNPEGGKVVRAQAVQPDQEAGNLYLPDPSIAGWIHDFVEECANFPNGKHDDMVDAFTQAVTYLNRHASPDIF